MDDTLLFLWKFIRGDMTKETFETFIYNDTNLEQFLGESLYFDVISANYQDPIEAYGIKEKLEFFAEQTFLYTCQCHRLKNEAVVGMGFEGEFFEPFETIIEKDDFHFWMYVSQCSQCKQRWLIAEEGVYNDDYYLYRLSDEEFNCIEKENKWPNRFGHYEFMPFIGHVFGKNNFTDQNRTNTPVYSIMYQIAKRNPGIKVGDLAQFLGIPVEQATKIAGVLIRESKVFITIPGEKNWIRKILYTLHL